MNSHEVQRIAAMMISLFIDYCIQAGITDELLQKSYSVADADQIKQEMISIAEQLQESADFHKGMRDGLNYGKKVQPYEP